MARSWFAAVLLLAVAPAVRPQPVPLPAPRTEALAPVVEPIAETKLLMAGLAKPNFDGLGRTLKDAPGDAAGWAFARGQALLVAETANLLLLRPPSDRAARDVWLGRAGDLRAAAVGVAKAAAVKDPLAARAGVAGLANACNRCHESFRVPTRTVPFDRAD